jgi:DNA-binding HxlR family transcriptional regulator
LEDLLDVKILLYLAVRGPSRKSDIVSALGVSWATLSRRLERLESRGLVAKTLTFAPGPTYLYFATPRGYEELRSLLRELEEALGGGKG